MDNALLKKKKQPLEDQVYSQSDSQDNNQAINVSPKATPSESGPKITLLRQRKRTLLFRTESAVKSKKAAQIQALIAELTALKRTVTVDDQNYLNKCLNLLTDALKKARPQST